MALCKCPDCKNTIAAETLSLSHLRLQPPHTSVAKALFLDQRSALCRDEGSGRRRSVDPGKVAAVRASAAVSVTTIVSPHADCARVSALNDESAMGPNIGETSWWYPGCTTTRSLAESGISSKTHREAPR